MTTRQQRRAKTRAPLKPGKGGTLPFVLAMTVVLFLGVFLIWFFRENRPELTRGAIVGEHWHAPYRVELCGRVLAPLPSIEDEIHSHGDPVIHVHPSTQELARDNANLGAFFRSYNIHIGQMPTGERGIIFPDGTRFLDGDECPDGESHELEVLVNGESLDNDPAEHIVHDEQEIIVRFGPEADLEQPMIPAPGFQGTEMPPGMEGMEITPEMLEEFERQQQEQPEQEGEPPPEGGEPGDS